jgi:hypothetical protein
VYWVCYTGDQDPLGAESVILAPGSGLGTHTQRAKPRGWRYVQGPLQSHRGKKVQGPERRWRNHSSTALAGYSLWQEATRVYIGIVRLYVAVCPEQMSDSEIE